MLRNVVRTATLGQRFMLKRSAPSLMSTVRRQKTSHEIVIETLGKQDGMYHEPEYNDEFMKKYATFFDRQDIDSWEIRRGLTDLHDMDCIPDIFVIESILRACRRLNDYALAIRYLESLRNKTGSYEKTIWPWLMQELTPIMKELGINSLEEMGYDKPELACKDVFD